LRPGWLLMTVLTGAIVAAPQRVHTAGNRGRRREWRLVVPRDERGRRYVSNIIRIDLRDAE
jgi:hypothetical protein